MQNDTIWRNCTNEEMMELLNDAPEVVEELKKIGYQDLVNAYDALLPQYNMDRVTTPINKEGSDEVEGFGYWYRIDGIEYDMKEGEVFKTKAEAQIASVRETVDELRKRILRAKE